MPQQLLHLFASFEQTRSQGSRISEQSCTLLSKSDDDGSSESGKFNESVYLIILLDPMHAVGQNESSFSVGVANLHSKSLSGTDDIQGPVAVAAHKIFSNTDYCHYVDWQFKLHRAFKGTEDRTSSMLIVVHPGNTGSRLQIQSSGVKTETLTDYTHELLGLNFSTPLQTYKCWLVFAGPAHSMQKIESFVEQLLSFDDLDTH